jgi:hypothetical protein
MLRLVGRHAVREGPQGKVVAPGPGAADDR